MASPVGDLFLFASRGKVVAVAFKSNRARVLRHLGRHGYTVADDLQQVLSSKRKSGMDSAKFILKHLSRIQVWRKKSDCQDDMPVQSDLPIL